FTGDPKKITWAAITGLGNAEIYADDSTGNLALSSRIGKTALVKEGGAQLTVTGGTPTLVDSGAACGGGGGAGAPGGSTGNMQFANSGVLGGAAYLNYDGAAGEATVGWESGADGKKLHFLSNGGSGT